MNVEPKAPRAPRAPRARKPEVIIIQVPLGGVIPEGFQLMTSTRKYQYAHETPETFNARIAAAEENRPYAPPTPPMDDSQESFVPPADRDSYENDEANPDVDQLLGMFGRGAAIADAAPAPAPAAPAAPAVVFQVPPNDFDEFIKGLGGLKLEGGALRRKKAKKSKKTKRSKVTKGKKNTRRS